MIFIKPTIIRLFCFLLIFIFLIPMYGCDDSKDAYIYFEMPNPPSTLDPQVASSDSELMIVRNIHEGLLRKDSEGNIALGIAESYSKDGLIYTFKLRKNAKWSDGHPITAMDFVFAFKRAVSPQTKAPLAPRLFSIKGAKEIYNGQANIDALGVTAVDERTLTITLIQDDSKLEETLTTSIAMPCNEAFFTSCSGKYGLSSQTILSSGSYKLSKWSKDTFGIRLYRNKEYEGKYQANNAAVFINGLLKDETTLERLEKQSTDMSFIDCTLLSQAKELGIKTTEFQNICWVLTLGNQFSQNMRKSLSMLIGTEVIANELPVGYSPATSLFPSALVENAAATGLTSYNPEAGKNLFLQELNNYEDKKFPSDTILYYYDDGHIKNTVTGIVGHWQSKLSAFVNIQAVTTFEKLYSQLTSQDYDMTIFPVRADSNNISEYLIKFGVDYAGEDLASVQESLLKSNHIIPIAYQNTVMAYSPDLENVVIEFSNGYVDFSYIKKDK